MKKHFGLAPNETTTFPWPTVGGYDYYEVVSALQKTIRRGDRDAAIFWATELYLSKYEAHAWRRMLVIASEDIGVADPFVFVQIRLLYDTWVERKKEDDAKLFFVDAILRLVDAAKCRITDSATIVFFEGDRPHKDIPDYALDVHTEAGRRLGRGYAHFFTEGAKLETATIPDPYEHQAKEIRIKNNNKNR
jgi:replication-associated recombination protein RarA